MYSLETTVADLSRLSFSPYALHPRGYLGMLTEELWYELLCYVHPLPKVRVGKDHVWYPFRNMGVTAHLDYIMSVPMPPPEMHTRPGSYLIAYVSYGEVAWIHRQRGRSVLLYDVVEGVQELGLDHCYVFVDDHHAYKVFFEYVFLLPGPVAEGFVPARKRDECRLM